MNRYTGLLTVTALGTYLLVVLGAMTAATDGVTLLAASHHAAAMLLWLFVAAAAVFAWVENRDWRVKTGATLAAVVYPLQALVGLAGLLGAPFADGRLHLLGGVAVFGLLLVTLVWHLDREVAAAEATEHGSAGQREGAGYSTDGSGTETAADRASADPADAVDEEASVAEGADVDDGVATAGGTGILDSVRSYVALTKPRLMWLLGLLALAGMALGTISGAQLDGVTVVATLSGGFLAVGAAGTFNHVYERDRDRRMDRTAERPVATRSIPPMRATTFGAVLFVASMVIFATAVNVLAAALTALAVVYYAVVYTVLLKPSTPWNTVLGGGAGALPAVIGWAAVTGGIGPPALVLTAVVFCWTPAHFYNLAIVHREDYARAEYPMLPVVRGVDTTRRRVLYWLGMTLLAAGALGVVAGFGVLYAVTSAVVGFAFVWTVAEQFRTSTARAAYRSFHTSNAYLGALLAAIVVEALAL